MKKKEFLSLGLMTGTSMDGVDLSLIKSDGLSEFTAISNDYHSFDNKFQSIFYILKIINGNKTNIVIN